MVQKTGSLDHDGETFNFVLMEDQMMQITHYMPMRNDMGMQKQIIDIELALARARKAAKTDREKVVLDPEDQVGYKAKTREYT